MRLIQRWRRGLLALAGLVVAGLAVASGVPPVLPAAPGSEAEAELMKRFIALDPSRSWSWLAAHEAARPQASADQQALRRAMVDFYLRQAAGEPWPREATLQATIEAGRSMRTVDSDLPSLQLYDTALQRGLQPRWPRDAVPLPGELESIGDRFVPMAPGLWLSRWNDGRARNLVLALEVVNISHVPLAPSELQLHWEGDRSGALRFRCPPERGEPPVLQPGARWRLVCRGEPIADERHSGIAEAASQLTAGTTPPTRWVSPDLRRQGGDQALVRLLSAAAPALTDDYARTFEPCDRRGRCAAENTRRGTRAGTEPPRIHRHQKPLQMDDGTGPSRRQAWLAVAGLVAAFMVFCAASRMFDDRRAAIGLMLLLTPFALWFGHGQGTASVLLMPASVFAALLLVLAFLAAYRSYDELVFSRFDAVRRERSLRPAFRRRGRRDG